VPRNRRSYGVLSSWSLRRFSCRLRRGFWRLCGGCRVLTNGGAREKKRSASVENQESRTHEGCPQNGLHKKQSGRREERAELSEGWPFFSRFSGRTHFNYSGPLIANSGGPPRNRRGNRGQPKSRVHHIPRCSCRCNRSRCVGVQFARHRSCLSGNICAACRQTSR